MILYVLIFVIHKKRQITNLAGGNNSRKASRGLTGTQGVTTSKVGRRGKSSPFCGCFC